MNCVVVELGVENVVQHGVEQRHIGARQHLQVDVGQLRRARSVADVRDDELGARATAPA